MTDTMGHYSAGDPKGDQGYTRVKPPIYTGSKKVASGHYFQAMPQKRLCTKTAGGVFSESSGTETPCSYYNGPDWIPSHP